MKFSAFVILSFASTFASAAPSNSRAGRMLITPVKEENNYHQVEETSSSHHLASPVEETIHRTLAVSACPNTANVGTDGRITSQCTYDASCTCTDVAYSVKENLYGTGCYHCSKPNGATCTSDHECLSGSACYDGLCATVRCPNTATILSNGLAQSQCSYSECQCSGEYNLKEDLNGSGCNHCAKSNGSTCSADHECSSSSGCYDGICGPKRCPNTATVSANGSFYSQCSNQACECTGEYNVKENLSSSGQCNHCAKPNGATCAADHECRKDSKCNSGICGPPLCPSASTWRCTYNANCVCADGKERTVWNGNCYAC